MRPSTVFSKGRIVLHTDTKEISDNHWFAHFKKMEPPLLDQPPGHSFSLWLQALRQWAMGAPFGSTRAWSAYSSFWV